MKLKKILLLLLFIVLVGCGQTQKEKTHEHHYEYGHDSRNHFLVCECDEEKDYTPHEFVEILTENTIDEKCSVCGYQKKSKNLLSLVDGIKFNSNQYYIYNEIGLINFAKIINGNLDEYPKDKFQNSIVKLTKDLDMIDYPWTPIVEEISYSYEEQYHKDNYMEGMIFDGCNHTISNLKIDGERSVGFIGITSSSFTIQNITFAKATVTATSGWVSVVVGYSSNKLTLSNITVKNSSLSGDEAYKIGGLIGMGQLAFGEIIITDCVVANTKFDGLYSVSGLAGELTGSEHCTFTNNTVSRCDFTVRDGELKSSPFAVWDSNFMSLDRSQNLNYFTSGTNCINNKNEDNNFIYGK